MPILPTLPCVWGFYCNGLCRDYYTDPFLHSYLNKRPKFEHCLNWSWLAGNLGMEKKMQTTIMRYVETTIRIHSFLHS